MQVSFAGISATCHPCGSDEFDAPAERLERADLLHCARCRNAVTYDDLIHQILGHAAHRARQSRMQRGDHGTALALLLAPADATSWRLLP